MSFSKAAFYLVAGALLVPCVGTVSALRLNAWARPAAPEAQIKAAWEKVLADSVELEATDPQGAITRYQQFFEETGYRSPAVGVQISLRIARIYQFEFRNYDKAIEIYDWALSLYKDQPTAIGLQKGRLAAMEAQNKAENVGGNQAPESAMGAAPLAVPIPKPAGGTSLGVNVGTPNKTGGLGFGANPFSSKSSDSKLGISLSSTTGVTQPVSISAPAPLGTALGWNPGQQRCVTALTQQPNGMLWVATEDSGVWRYDPAVAQGKDKWTQFTAKDGLADESAYALAVDQKGRVWAGTLNHGVSVWNGREWKNYGVLDGPLGERVFDIAICPTDGDVWIATNAGLTRYSQQKDSWSYVTRADGLPSDQVQAIAFDKDGNIVLGTQCDGVALAQAADGYKMWRVVHGPDKMPLTATGVGLPSSLINDVLVARDGTIYAATTTGLAWSSDGGAKWAYVRGQDYADKVRGLYGGAPVGWREGAGALLAEDYVSCLAQGEAGRLWIGHWREGSEMLQMRSSFKGSGVQEVSFRKGSGFVKAMLPRAEGALLLARYDEGLSYGSAATEGSNEAPTAATKPNAGVGDLTIKVPVPVPADAKAKVTVEPQIGVGDLTVKFPSTSKANINATATIEPQTEVVNAAASVPRVAENKTAVEPKAVAASKTAVSPTVAALPTAAKAPTLDELNALIALLGKVEPLDTTEPFITELDDDWKTQGDWLGRYGRYNAVLAAMVSPGNLHWGAGEVPLQYNLRIDPREKRNSLRYWVHWLKSDNPRVLEMPPLYFQSRLKMGLADSINKRRQSEIDDNGEAYPLTKEGPSIYATIRIPKGIYYLSFYNHNKDGHDTINRRRDYLYSVRSHDSKKPLFDVSGFDSRPDLARARQEDFWGGTYKRFLVSGPQDLTIKIDRNNSFNAILAGIFLDLVDEEPPPYFTSFGEWEAQHDQEEGLRKGLSLMGATTDVFSTVPATEAEAVETLWTILERVRVSNPKWWAEERRRFYVPLVKWLEASKAQATTEARTTNLDRVSASYYHASLFELWEKAQEKRGLTPARQTELQLEWDGKQPTTGSSKQLILASANQPSKENK